MEEARDSTDDTLGVGCEMFTDISPGTSASTSTDRLQVLRDEMPEIFQLRQMPQAVTGCLAVRLSQRQAWGSFAARSGATPRHTQAHRLQARLLEALIERVEHNDVPPLERLAGGWDDEAPPIAPHLQNLFPGGPWSGSPFPGGPRLHREPQPGAADLSASGQGAPPVASLSFYLPFHLFGAPHWGIYLSIEGVVWLACDLRRRSAGRITPQRAVEAAQRFGCELAEFHHKAEFFVLQLELWHRRARYVPIVLSRYAKTMGTGACLEEGLASAYALSGMFFDQDGRAEHPGMLGGQSPGSTAEDVAIYNALSEYVRELPEGYGQGWAWHREFLAHRNDFAEATYRACLPHAPAKPAHLWGISPSLFAGLSSVRSRVHYLVEKRSSLAALWPDDGESHG